MKNIISNFIALFYPNLCDACGETLVSKEKVLCLNCRYALPKTNYWNEQDNLMEQAFWGRVGIEKACSYFFFNKGSNFQKLLHNLKYNGREDIGIYLGKLFGSELVKCGWCNAVDLIVPVPLHAKKQRKRGYNQSECIAKGMSESIKLAVVVNNLVKISSTESQTQKGRMERWENVSEVFNVYNPAEFENKHILLIDDTMTTGATIEACAQALLNSCNCTISVATLAYVR